jgi:pimeloyl-ACP methyl ester carboxylesterase
MPSITTDGYTTRYEVTGSGPAILMYAPAGFDATLEKWRTQGVYHKCRMIEHLEQRFTCIVFDRRECGQSGGRVERVTWEHSVRQGLGLLDHLGIEKAHMMGGCMGCPPVATFGVTRPDRVLSMILYWPVGGPKFRMASQQRFAEHLAFVQANGLEAVAALARQDGKTFTADPRGGPWAAVLKHDAAFAERYAKLDVAQYKAIVAGMARTMFDRDTAPGPEPEDLMRCNVPALIVPGNDPSHATSAARYLHECLPRSQYWDVQPADQTEENTPARLIAFLESAGRS